MASSREATVDTERYIGVMAGARLSKRSPAWVQRLAVIGRVRTRLEPGVPARYSETDILRAAADANHSQSEGVA
jgi:hypothetical protein